MKCIKTFDNKLYNINSTICIYISGGEITLFFPNDRVTLVVLMYMDTDRQNNISEDFLRIQFENFLRSPNSHIFDLNTEKNFLQTNERGNYVSN